MTMDELDALDDKWLVPFLVLTDLMFAGEMPPVLKRGDVAPLPKDLFRVRPITCLDPVFQLVDGAINSRLMKVHGEHGFQLDIAFGFVKGGACEWPVECALAVQRDARRRKVAALMNTFDNTSAYDTISHRGISVACDTLTMPPDVAASNVNHAGGHSRVIITAYGAGDDNRAVELDGGVAQGARKSPGDFTTTVTPAHE